MKNNTLNFIILIKLTFYGALFNCIPIKFDYKNRFQITFNSVAYDAGLKNRDYIYEVNGMSVLGMDHDECTKLIKDAGNSIDLKIER